MSALCRRAAIAAANRAAGLPAWASDMRPVRGRCLKRRCKSRWGVIRVSLDFRDPDRVDRLATLECASCGRTWRRVRAPESVRSRAGYQTVRLSLILPGNLNRWFSRGRWHREGDDAIVLRDADLGDVDEAARAHRARGDRKAAAAARAAERKAADDAAAIARMRETLARLDARAAEREAEEAAAAAREAAYG